MKISRKVGIAAGFIKKAAHVEGGLEELVDHITFGSFTREPRDGNPEPRYWFDHERQMSLNAVGLANDGAKDFFLRELGAALNIRKAGCRLRVSLAPLVEGDLETMLRQLARCGLNPRYVNELEVNAACPNHRSKEGRLHDVLAHDPVALETLMKESDVYPGPKAIKIAPLMSNESLTATVELAVKYHFTSIVSGNTLLRNAEGKLGSPTGGMGGEPLFDHALAQVVRLRSLIDALPDSALKPDIIACGGAMSASNVTAYLEAGAAFVQVATYYHQYGAKGVRDLVAELV
jgi:dihydroorotate dehydrogenase